MFVASETSVVNYFSAIAVDSMPTVRIKAFGIREHQTKSSAAIEDNSLLLETILGNIIAANRLGVPLERSKHLDTTIGDGATILLKDLHFNLSMYFLKFQAQPQGAAVLPVICFFHEIRTRVYLHNLDI